MKRGESAESASAWRSRITAALTLFSNSTIVLSGHSFFWISSRETTSPGCSRSISRIWKDCS